MDPANLLDPNSGNPGGAGLGGAQAPAGGNANPQPDPPVVRDWMKDLPEPLKASKSLSKFTDQEWKANLAKSYVELEGKLGKSVVLPAQDASAEDWQKFYERVGRPKAADEYAIDRGSAPDEQVKAFKALAHEAGLTNAQANKMWKDLQKSSDAQRQAALEQYTARAKESDALLRKEYGALYDGKMADARKAYATVFDTDLQKEIAEAGLAANPRFIRVMAELGAQLKDDAFLRPAGDGGAKPKTYYDEIDARYKGTA